MMRLNRWLESVNNGTAENLCCAIEVREYSNGDKLYSMIGFNLDEKRLEILKGTYGNPHWFEYDNNVYYLNLSKKDDKKRFDTFIKNPMGMKNDMDRFYK